MTSNTPHTSTRDEYVRVGNRVLLIHPTKKEPPVTSSTQHAPVRDEYLRIGDRVIVRNVRYLTDLTTGPSLPDGTVLVCVGYAHTYDFVDFGIGYSKRRPRGRYQRFCGGYFELAEAEGPIDHAFRFSSENLVFEDLTLRPEQDRRPGYMWQMCLSGRFYDDLPPTEFYVGDQVIFTNQASEDPERVEHLTVDRVIYGHGGNPNALPYYDVSGRRTYRGLYAHPLQAPALLSLVRRGPIYRYLHNEPLELEGDVRGQARFYSMIGEYEPIQVTPPLHPDDEQGYHKELVDAVKYVRNGRGSMIRTSSISGVGRYIEIGHFPNVPGLDEELRILTLQEYSHVVPSVG